MLPRQLHPPLAALLAALTVFAGVFALDSLERKRTAQDQRLHVIERVSALRSKLESGINRTVAASENIAILFALRPDLAHEQFIAIAQKIVASNPAIQQIDLIQDSVVREAYPQSGNQPGNEPGLRSDTSRQFTHSRTPLILPPAPGSAVFTAYIPVLRHDSPTDRVSGALTAEIRLKPLLQDAGFADLERQLLLALRPLDQRRSFYGPSEIFSDYPVIQPVHLSGGTWEIAARPREGWTAVSPTQQIIRTLGAALCLLAAALAFLLVRHLQRRTDAEHRLNTSEAQLKQRTAELIHQNAVLEMLTHNADLPDILEMVALLVEVHHPDMLCSILLLDPDGLHLRHGAAPNLPDFYNQAIDGLAISEDAGCCGAAAYRGERVIVEDIQKHPDWTEFCAFAERANLRSCWSQPIKDSAQRTIGTFAIYHRYPTKPKSAEIMLIERYAALASLAIERTHNAEAMRLHDTALNSAANAIVITNLDGRIVWANPAYCKLTGYEFEEIIGREHADIVKSGMQDDAFYAKMWETILSGNIWHGELINRRKDGSLFHDEMTITPVRDQHDRITHFVAIKQDITSRKQHEEHLKTLAFYDPLTQLPNRRLLIDRLCQAQASCKRTGCQGALLFLDLDNFKPLNDECGHDVGDLLLAEAAHRITCCIREDDTVSRFGGDEFVVLLRNLNADPAQSTAQAIAVAEKIRAALAEPYCLRLLQVIQGREEVEHRCTTSIGITLFSGQKIGAEELLKQADIAMYQSKATGRNRISLYAVTDG